MSEESVSVAGELWVRCSNTVFGSNERSYRVSPWSLVVERIRRVFLLVSARWSYFTA